ncbi:hypothetical protein Tco_1302625 [Tanacetum coccineum]
MHHQIRHRVTTFLPSSQPLDTTYKTSNFLPIFLGCPPPNHHRGGGRTTVQPPQPHLVVSGCIYLLTWMGWNADIEGRELGELSDQDSLNAAAGGNLLTKTPKDALTLIENKSKVCTSRNRPVLTKVSTNTSTSGLLPNVVALTDAVKALLLKNRTPLPASVKAVEESCVTGGGPHPYYQCLATDGNVFPGYQDNIQAYVYAAAVNYNQGNAGHRPPSIAHQVQPPGFLPVKTIKTGEIITTQEIQLTELRLHQLKLLRQ